MSKKTIMLVCSAGMSTSLLVTKMEEAAVEKGLDVDIFAIPIAEIEENIGVKQLDAILLGPQVRFMKEQLEDKTAANNIPVYVVDMVDYGRMNGEKVLDIALDLMND